MCFPISTTLYHLLYVSILFSFLKVYQILARGGTKKYVLICVTSQISQILTQEKTSICCPFRIRYGRLEVHGMYFLPGGHRCLLHLSTWKGPMTTQCLVFSHLPLWAAFTWCLYQLYAVSIYLTAQEDCKTYLLDTF